MNRTDCPSPGTLAAFVDGRLEGDARRRVIEHLDACEDCYEVVAETLHDQAAEADDPIPSIHEPSRSAEAPGRVVPFDREVRRGRSLPWLGIAAAAALLALAVVLLPVLRSGDDGPALASAELVDGLAAPADRLVAARLQPMSGLGFAPAPHALDRRVGAGLVDLRVAVDSGAVAAITRELESLRQSAVLATEGEGDIDRVLSPLRESIADGDLASTETAELRQALDDLDDWAVAHLDADSVRLGSWAEAGRLAAATGDRAFFRTDRFVAEREAFAARSVADTAPLVGLLRRDPLSDADLAEIERRLTRLLTSS